MPQMDNEFFLVYFFCISTLLIYFMIDDNINESFIVLNIRFFLFSYFKNAKHIFNFEKFILKKLLSRRLNHFIRMKKIGG